VAFLVRNRRHDGATAAASSGEVATPPPPVDGWDAQLRRSVGELLDRDPATLGAPSPLPHGFGPWAFELAGTSVRLAPDRAELDREVAAIAHNRRHGLGAPAVLGVVAVDAAPVRWALVTEGTTQVPLPDLIGFNLHHANTLLVGFASHHHAIHDTPVDDLVAVGEVPRIDPLAELARIDAERYPAEIAWLAEHVPAPEPPVLCHGGYQPLATFGPPPEEWDAHGGPGAGLTVVNWGAAVLAEVAYDVAFTLVAFWSAPYFAPNRSERTAIKMIRNTLLNTYKQGYAACATVDLDRLRYWQAFHALRGRARLTGAYDADGSPFAAPDRGAVPTELEPELARLFRQLTRVRPDRP
jgi:aminoglycoside phosphotransferase (APT) family kinase protein